MPLFSSMRSLLLFLLLLPATLFAADKKPIAKEGWLEIHSAHFDIITDAGEKRGREVAVRLEQMRMVFAGLIMRDKLKMPVPVEVLALKSDADYEKISPLRKRTAISDPGFFLGGEDKHIIVLDLFADQPWRAVAHYFAHMLLDGNYPPTQTWFDEGLAEYFSSIQLDNKTIDIGSDPELLNKYAEDLLGNITDVRHPPKSFTELLSGPLWLNMSDFLQMRLSSPEYHEGTHHTLFYAQSWILAHYLLAKKMMPQVGTYFGLVEVQKMSVEQAVQQAFGMNTDQLEKALKDYFHSLTPLFAAQDKADAAVQSDEDIAAARNSGTQLNEFPAPIGPGEVSVVVKKMIDDDAHAYVADAMARLPEHRAEGIQQLQNLAQDPADNAIAHRCLAYAYLQNRDFKQTGEQLRSADGTDPWVHYYEALLRFRAAQARGQALQGGLANVQQNLRAVVDWDPEFAEAYHFLALSELEGGGTHAALDSIRTAIQLAPRRQSYVLDMANIYIAQKKWDEAQAALERLKSGSNAQLAAVARKKLDDLPFIKKYGIDPDRSPGAQETRVIEANSGISNPLPENLDEKPQLKERAPDTRPVKYVKGRIVSVDCGKAPEAIMTVLAGGRTLKLHTFDYKSVALVGADQFSCDWRNQRASINYKAGGGSQGDVVSVEID
jgi:tetratricopeptide (TPR) repeat protein